MNTLRYSNLLANAATTVKTGEGVLAFLTINTKGASSNTITLYDGTSTGGTKIGTIDSTVGVGSLIYGVRFITGLHVVIATGTAADITVCYE